MIKNKDAIHILFGHPLGTMGVLQPQNIRQADPRQ
jgi:hypothetical protein